MDFSGYSSEYLVVGDIAKIVRRFSEGVSERWPRCMVNQTESGKFDFDGLVAARDEGSEEPDIVCFSRDRDMEDFWEENGYELDPSGEGPVGIFHRPVDGLELRVTEGREVRPGGGVAMPRTTVFLPRAHYVSLVTPEDPAEDEFSGWVVERFAAALRE